MGKDKGMEGQWKGDKGMRGQRTGGTKDWRDKGLEDNGEWRQRNNEGQRDKGYGTMGAEGNCRVGKSNL